VRRKYLVGPFIGTFACWTLGGGTLPILPLYAMERGASESMSGLFLAFAFLCLALGTMATGLLPKDFRNRKWLIAASGLLMVGLTWLTGHTTTLMQFAGTIGLTWFLAGVVFSQAATLTGLAADPGDRGTAFGILGMSSGFGSLIGGLGVGYLADRVGFAGVFGSLTAFNCLIVIGGLLSVEKPAVPAMPVSPGADSGSSQPMQKATVALLVLLLGSQFLLAVTNGAGSLGRSLAMSSMGFSKSTITMTVAIQGVVGIGFPPALGWLSDKVGRRGILIAIYLVTSMSLVLMAFSRAAWHFYTSVGLFTFLSFSLSVGPAYVVDIVPREGTAIGVSLFQSMFWAGSIVGMAASGFAFDRLGTTAPILFSCLFPVAGVVLLLLIRERRR
jgi:MFS family permease